MQNLKLINKQIKEIYPDAPELKFVNKGLYKHYGIYVGNNTVVHYSDKSSNFGLDIKVQEASLADFAGGFEVKVCRLDPKKYTLYSADETIKRAYSRLGEKDYNLVFNNCEHFAVWCKTGISDSAQVHKAVTAAVVISIGAILWMSWKTGCRCDCLCRAQNKNSH